MNFKGLINKAKGKADILAFLIAAYERTGNLGNMIDWYTSSGPIEAIRECKDINILKYKLLDSDHLYSKMFKYAALLRVANEFGVLQKYKAMAEKVMFGAGLAAITLPGSTPSSTKANFARAPLISTYEY